MAQDQFGNYVRLTPEQLRDAVKMTLSRRGLITGLASLVVAPAVVKAANIMPVKGFWWESIPAPFDRYNNPGVWPRLPGVMRYDDRGGLVEVWNGSTWRPVHDRTF